MHAGQRGDQLRGAGDRQVVRAHRQCRAGVDPRPVLHPAGHPVRRQPDADLPALRALLRLNLVLRHLRRRGRRGLEHLPFLHPRGRRIAQAGPAAAARRRPALHRVIRVARLLQRGRFRAGLPAGLAAGPAAQRPVLRLLRIRAVRRRRLRRRPGVLRQAALQVRDLRGQRRDLRVPHRQLRCGQLIPVSRRLPQPGVDRLQLRYPRTQQADRVRWRRRRRIGHPPHSAGTGEPRSTRHTGRTHKTPETRPTAPTPPAPDPGSRTPSHPG